MQKYKDLICGGRSDNLWETTFKLEAETMKEAVDKITSELPIDSDIVEISQEY